MLLSIVMMVKDEAKNLRRCLGNLKSILNTIPSELIILDTGSRDNTVEIAKEYTDKVYFHLWNNNFADMRNKSISYAKGKWVFIIDADEVLEDTREIISFFQKGKYKRYNTGFIKIKNYTKKSKYTLNSIARLFRKDKVFRYEGAIHEQPIIREPIYFFESEIIHHGYSTEDKALMERKFERNVEILRKELDKDPENIYYWFQLSQSYGAYSHMKEGLEAALKAYSIAKSKKINLSNKMYVYTQLAFFYYKDKKHNELEKICKEALTTKDGYLDLYYFLGHAQLNLHKDEEALKNYEIYLEMLPKYNKLPASKDITVTVYSLDIYEYVYGELCQIYTRLENFEKVLYYADKIKIPEALGQTIPYIITAYFKLEKYEEIVGYYHTKIRNLPDRTVEKFIENLESEIKSIAFKNKLMLWESFSHEVSDYGFLNKVRLTLNNKLDFDEENIKSYVEKINFNKTSNFYGDIIFYFLKRGRNISNIIGNVRDDKLKQYFLYLYLLYSDEFIKLGKKYVSSFNEEVTYEEKKFVKSLCHFLLASVEFQEKEYKEIFKNYITNGTDYIKEIYHSNVIENERIDDLKNDEEAFLLYIYHAKNNKAQNPKTYISYLRKALEIYPEMRKGIEVLIKEVTETKQDQTNTMDEMETYKKQFKENIQSFIEQGLLQEAKDMVTEYEKIVKYDIDVYSIKGVIAMMEGDMGEAEKILSKGLDIQPSNCDLMYNLAYLYETRGMYLLAYKYYRKLTHVTEESIVQVSTEKIRQLEQIDEIKGYMLEQKDELRTEELIMKLKRHMEELRAMTKN